MKNKIILFVLIICFSKSVICQITKGNWLVGGSARGSMSNSSLNGSYYKVNSFSLSPNMGYFLFDKFSAGLKFSVDYSKVKYPETGNGVVNVGLKNVYLNGGPFLRYYFLNTDKLVNLFVETSYQFQSQNSISTGFNSKQLSNVFSISSGLVVYFNSSVGIEFIVGFNSIKYKNTTGSFNSLFTGIGLQIHLIKDKN
jgi:hypothetical protein